LFPAIDLSLPSIWRPDFSYMTQTISVKRVMQPFTFHTPTKIVFGPDTASGVVDAVEEMGCSKPFIVTDANLIKAGVLAPIFASFTGERVSKPIVFDAVPPDSDLDCVRKSVEAAKAGGCDMVIAIGGGSVIDTAKVTAIGLSRDGDVLQYEGMNTLESRLCPMIAIPTTAGTGSEVSAVAMIKQDLKKIMFGSRFLFPDLAILDPHLLVTLPPRLTAATGMDALTHAIESYVSTTANSPSDALSLEAMRLIFENLLKATESGDDLDARAALLVASTMAGVAFTNAGVGIVHALAHTVGAVYSTHHGLTNAVFLPHGIVFNKPTAREKYATAYGYLRHALRTADKRVAAWFEADIKSTDDGAEKLAEAVRKLISTCGLPLRLKDLGVSQPNNGAWQELASISLTDPAIMFNPQEASEEDLVNILKRAY
jgi:alcohol dehydrogenase class IV